MKILASAVVGALLGRVVVGGSTTLASVSTTGRGTSSIVALGDINDVPRDRSSSLVVNEHDDQQMQNQQPRQQRKLQTYEKIWNYTPRTKITDIAAIDLDMVVMEGLLGLNDFTKAERLYKEGGHVGSTAIVELVTALDQDIPAGSSATFPIGETGGEDTGVGTLYVNASRGDKILLIKYFTTNNQDNFVGCQVGALPNPKTSGCIVESGTVTFPDINKNYDYNYKKLEENINLRTFLTLALDAQNFVENETFNRYREYYGSALYMDKITTAAFNSRNAGSGRGDMDFSLFDEKGNKEIVAMSIVLMTMWMTVVGSLEEAIHECKTGKCSKEGCQGEMPGVHMWDSAVAQYAGSLVDFASHKGNMLFYYADKMCEEFKTCGNAGFRNQGNAFVNFDVFRYFVDGQRDLVAGNCDRARNFKGKIINLMKVPLIQGAMRYAHMVEGEMKLGDVEKHDAEAAGYALAVLPLVHHCSPKDAEILFNNFKPKSQTSMDFTTVKYTLERNYRCMNVQCHHVGGIHPSDGNGYKPGAEPCSDLTSGLSQQGRNWVIAIVFTVATIFVAAFIVCCVNKREKSPIINNNNVEPKNNDLQLQVDEGEMT